MGREERGVLRQHRAHQPFGEGYAGQAAQERSFVHIPDLAKEHDKFLRKILLAGENFVSYYGVPLIAKGQVMGVLEVFQRTQLKHDEEWLDFLKALAAQGTEGRKPAILGALTLYLDFINLFLMLLRFTGSRR